MLAQLVFVTFSFVFQDLVSFSVKDGELMFHISLAALILCNGMIKINNLLFEIIKLNLTKKCQFDIIFSMKTINTANNFALSFKFLKNSGNPHPIACYCSENKTHLNDKKMYTL